MKYYTPQPTGLVYIIIRPYKNHHFNNNDDDDDDDDDFEVIKKLVSFNSFGHCFRKYLKNQDFQLNFPEIAKLQLMPLYSLTIYILNMMSP